MIVEFPFRVVPLRFFADLVAVAGVHFLAGCFHARGKVFGVVDAEGF